MDHKWLEIRLSAPSAAVDAVCAELSGLGSTGVQVEERKLDTFVPPDPDADLPAQFPLRAYFPAAEAPNDLRRRVEEGLRWVRAAYPGAGWGEVSVGWMADGDWADSWKQHFPVFRVGPLVVRPSWENVAAAPGEVLLTIDPGMAFGTGTHATTRLCLEALVAEMTARPTLRRVLDVGTGSGILAVAAAALGASRILAADIDPDACRVAADNARLNGLEGRVEFTVTPLAELEAGFDMVLANILAEENVRLAAELVARLAPDGRLILSGILQEKEGLVRAGFAAFGLEGPVVSRQDEWSCLVYRKRA